MLDPISVAAVLATIVLAASYLFSRVTSGRNRAEWQLAGLGLATVFVTAGFLL